MRVLIVAKHLPIGVSAAAEHASAEDAPVSPARTTKVHGESEALASSSHDADLFEEGEGSDRLCFGDEALWPLFDCGPPSDGVNARDEWTAYRRVNESFAAALAKNYQRGDLIVVCDYQLALVPALVRAMKPELRIAIFLHVPFPPPEMFRLLPWRQELLRGLVGADLIGFQGLTSAEYFKISLAEVLGLEASSVGFVADGRVVRLGVYPVGIDVRECETQARAVDLERDIERVRELAAGKAIVLSVVPADCERDDSSPTVERLLKRAPGLFERVYFVEVVAPNSIGIGSNSQPAARELSCLYRAADVALIAASSDATNVMEREYVASRIYESGVLIVAEHSDSAREFREALRAKPNDVDSVVGAIEQGLQMGRIEQRFRMRALRARVARNGARRWAQLLIADLLGRPPALASAGPEELLLKHLAELRYEERVDLFLTYDGTLVPFAPVPELALPDPELCLLLERLARCERLRVHVMSGRRRNELESWFGSLPIGLHAEHGYWSRLGPQQAWIAAELGRWEWKQVVTSIFADLTKRTAGSRVEEKTASVAWHYRAAEPELAVRRLQEARSRLATVGRRQEFELVDGAKVLEARRRGIHTGRIVRSALSTGGKRGVIAACADANNDELFTALPAAAATIHVGAGPTQAAYQVSCPAQLRSVLNALIDAGGAR